MQVSFRHLNIIRTVHISFPPNTNVRSEDGRVILGEAEMLDLVECLGPQLQLFGVSTRVYRVTRHVVKQDGGNTLSIRTQLTPYRSPEIPEQFLVVQT